MKNIKNSIMPFLFGCLALALVSCNKDKESADLAKVTTFATLTIEKPIMGLPLGTDFTEPGDYAAFEGATDLTNNVTISGGVDKNTVGTYQLAYSVLNSDGYPATVNRLVVVYDASSETGLSSTDISGVYNCQIERLNEGATVSRGPYSMTIAKLGDGIFYIPDFLGFYYSIGAGYGSDYAYDGMFVLHNDNTITLNYADPNKGWGDGIDLDRLEQSSNTSYYDPATETIKIVSYMGSAPYEFNITLTK